MQTVNVLDSSEVQNLTNVKNAIDTYGSAFFSGAEVDTTSESGWARLKLYVNGVSDPAMILRSHINNDSGDSLSVITPHGTDYFYGAYSGNDDKVKAVVFTDNAVLIQMNYQQYHVLIYKNTNGEICALYRPNNNIPQGRNSTYQFIVCNLTQQTYYTPSYFMTTNAQHLVVGMQIIDPNGVSSDVYIAENADFASLFNPFNYLIGDQVYTGMNYNQYIVKGT